MDPIMKPASSRRNRIRTALAVAAVAALLLAGCRSPREPSLIEGDTIPGVTAFRMVTDREGWAAKGHSILRTGDGGQTWQDVSPTSAATPYPIGGYFADADRAWVTVVAAEADKAPQTVNVYRTSDGGKTWDSSRIDAQAMGAQIQFVDARTGFIMVRQGVAMMHEAVSIYTTTDGGATWEPVSATSIESEPGKLPFVGDKTGMTFRTKDNGFVCGYIPAPGSPYMHETEDGGHTWSEADLAVPEGYKEHEMIVYPPIFHSESEGILPVELYGDHRELVFYSTEDGGSTWRQGAVISVDSSDTSLLWNSPAPGLIILIAGNRLQVSEDSGKTWRTIESNFDFSGAAKLSFVSARVGWILANGTLYRTTDGGKTWKQP